MIYLYRKSPLVDEVIIIKNHKGWDTTHMEKQDKIRVLNDGNNLFVNPSWNLGAAEAKSKNILIANDDIYVSNIYEVLKELDYFLKPGMLIGAGINCFAQKRKRLPKECVITKAKFREYGFGVFMAIQKESYISIPDELKVWFGDTFLFDQLDTYVIETEIKTEMRATTKTMNLKAQHKKEQKFYELWREQLS
jgi:hypothetical protein